MRSVWLVALFALLLAARARAEDTLDLSQIKDVARAKAEEGLALYGQERWQDAYTRFRLAEELYHAPTLLLFMGNCKRALGELRAARALYERVAGEAIAADAPPAFAEAQASARAALEELEEQIPRVTVSIRGVPPERARLTIDGQLAPIGEELLLDPGRHRLQASAPGSEAAGTEVDLRPGARERVELTLRSLAPSPPPAPPPREPEPGPLWPAGIGLGVAVAGFALGGIAGGVVMSRVSDLEERCRGTECPLSLESEADELRPIAAASNAGFAIGGAGLVAAVVLFIVRPGGEDAPEAARHVSLAAAPAALQLSGSF